MITSFKSYIEGVMISASQEQEGWREDMPPKLYNILHATVGLTTEIGEILEAFCIPTEAIDWVNVKEELGDMWWYVGLMAHIQGNDIVLDMIEDPQRGNLIEGIILVNDIMILNAAASNVVKRRIFYDTDGSDKKSDWDLVDVLSIATRLMNLTNICGFSVSDVWTTNLLKLIGPDGRYKDTFDADKAVCRDLIKEREVLES